MKDTVQAELQLLGHEQERTVLPKVHENKPTELDFFEAVYLDESVPLGYRLKAAAERAKYTHAQLRAIAYSQMDQQSFAVALERCLARSAATYLPKPALPAPEQHPASELKGNFPMRRRNLR